MASIKKFEDLIVWQKARELSKSIYVITDKGNFSRDFGLKDQIRRSGISVMSNISEGFERDGKKELLQFLSIAKGSVGELRSQLYIALDQHYITQSEFDQIRNQAIEISRLINSFCQYLRKSELTGIKYKEVKQLGLVTWYKSTETRNS